MSNLVYPSAIQGLTFTVLRTPELSTIVQRSASGSELRIPQMNNPIWHFELIYDFIFGNFNSPNNTMPYAPFTDLDTLVGFYVARGGQSDNFLWTDPKNNYVGPAIFSAPPAGNMLMNGSGLVVNAFNDVAGRGDYFHEASGTSEGQFLLLLGMLEAYGATGSATALARGGSGEPCRLLAGNSRAARDSLLALRSGGRDRPVVDSAGLSRRRRRNEAPGGARPSPGESAACPRVEADPQAPDERPRPGGRDDEARRRSAAPGQAGADRRAAARSQADGGRRAMTQEFLVRLESDEPIERMDLLRVVLGLERLRGGIDRIEVRRIEPAPAFGLHRDGRLVPAAVIPQGGGR